MSPDEQTPAPAETVEEARAQIEETRADLGDTVEQLAAKADVKGRAKEKVADLRDDAAAASHTAAEQARANQTPLVAGAVIATGLVVFLLWRSRR